jgi:energy-converting hydrogenase Eha subunit C
MNVHVSIAEASAGGEMKVANDLVHLQETVNPTTLTALLFQSLGVVLSLALLKGSAVTKGPRSLRVSLADFLAAIAAARFLDVARRRRTTAITTVAGIQVLGLVFVESKRPDVNVAAAFGFGSKSSFADAVSNAVLLLARHIHHIKRQELAGHSGECNVEVNIHSFT